MRVGDAGQHADAVGGPHLHQRGRRRWRRCRRTRAGRPGRAAVGRGEGAVARAARRELLADRRGVDERGARGRRATVSQSGSRPRSGSSSNSPMATPSTVKVRARRTPCACTPSTATSTARSPSASGATSGDATRAAVDGERAVERVEVRIARGRGGVDSPTAPGAPPQLGAHAVDEARDQRPPSSRSTPWDRWRSSRPR